MLVKEFIKSIPVVGDLARKVHHSLNPPPPFRNSAEYWENRYARGGNSGVGSYNKFAEFKAEVLNEFIRGHHIHSVIEFGCGDGNQLSFAFYPKYTGYDVSTTAVELCRKRFAADSTKTFRLSSEYAGETAELALSLDVIFHLVEDHVFERYMRQLFTASQKYVAIYSSDTDENSGYENTYIRHRKFTRWVQENTQWKLTQHIPNPYSYQGDYTKGSFADFFIYEIL